MSNRFFISISALVLASMVLLLKPGSAEGQASSSGATNTTQKT